MLSESLGGKNAILPYYLLYSYIQPLSSQLFFTRTEPPLPRIAQSKGAGTQEAAKPFGM